MWNYNPINIDQYISYLNGYHLYSNGYMTSNIDEVNAGCLGMDGLPLKPGMRPMTINERRKHDVTLLITYGTRIITL